MYIFIFRYGPFRVGHRLLHHSSFFTLLLSESFRPLPLFLLYFRGDFRILFSYPPVGVSLSSSRIFVVRHIHWYVLISSSS